ncbi:pilus assembly protein [Geoalkalibacter halelectricus]|uniref:pilus assembly protein n=1 Tax=Geoalkalibacter halelectricus TaxID=2847045 RepID=UPI003D1CD073
MSEQGSAIFLRDSKGLKRFFRLIGLMVTLLLLLTFQSAWAGPDDYLCDTAIFGAGGQGFAPNVLIIVDTSGSMRDKMPVQPYNANITYPQSNTCGASGNQPCVPDEIYECDSPDLNCKLKKAHATYPLTDSCGPGNDELWNFGIWPTNEYEINNNRNDCIFTGGDGRRRRSGSWNYYVTGNWANYRAQVVDETKIQIAKRVVKDVVAANPGVRFGLMRFNFENGGRFATSGTYTAYVDDLNEIWQGGTTKRTKFYEAVDNLTAEGWTPLAETLFEARAYFRGLPSVFNSGTYTSPMQAHCQNNYIILVSDGMSTRDDDPVLRTICDNGDCTGSGPTKQYNWRGTDHLIDVAWELYNTDMFPHWPGKQNVTTYMVGFGLEGAVAEAVELLDAAMHEGTGGRHSLAFLANDPDGFSAALTAIIDEIREVHTSFATPVAPASPQNRYASGEHIYLSLFQPIGNGRWRGNLKKFGLAADGRILDSLGLEATRPDGRFKDSATSYWSVFSDGAEVDKGGAGALLANRNLINNPRNIYTNLGPAQLTHGDNRFALGNAALTRQMLGVGSDSERDLLMRFVQGFDAYDDNANGNTGENRDWILGDILHSSPAVVHYSANQSVIFVGANDGQLRAFNDGDGQELWSFIPDILLPDLKYLRDGHHTYFVDMTPTVFVLDKNQNGVIEADAGDRVILLFGLRRGGGKDRLLSPQVRGGYYALDVSNPAQPEFLWKITSATPGFAELGESWSNPTLARMRVEVDGVVKDKLVAVFGAGYDNNEDRRFGNTQSFPPANDATDTTLPTLDAGQVTSPGGGAQHNPRGRGIYAVKVGEFSGATFERTTSPRKIWGYTVADNAAMTFSIPSEVAALDLSHNGYVDRFYVGDTGGRVWRIDARAALPADWGVELIFDANGGQLVEKGRKFFQRPSVTVERNRQPMIFIGSGDRSHPLNEAVVDRLYAIKDPLDRPASKPAWDATPLTEAALVDVTDNVLQADSLSDEARTRLGVTSLEEAIAKTLEQLREQDGWYIRLDLRDGEKILASPLVFNKVAYFTTYTPGILISDDPCQTGNLGVARLYAVDYLSGEAVRNYDLTNDGQDTAENLRAQTRDGKVLRRSDRERTLGSGIPSGIVVMVPEVGEPRLLIGCDGGICVDNAGAGGRVQPLYWLQR